MGEISPGIPQALIDRAVEAGIDTFIETGYHTGDTITKADGHFKHIYSIELSEELYRTGVTQWASWANIHLIQGDSGKELGHLLERLNTRALIWLDAHWSGRTTARGDTNTPIKAELEALRTASHKDHTIAIDDLEEFTGNNGYPTVTELLDAIHAINPAYQVNLHTKLRRGVLEAWI